MRWLVAYALLAPAAPAYGKPVAPPPFQRHCLAPATWAEVTTCTNLHARGTRIVDWAKDLKVVHTPSSGSFLFYGRDNLWRSVYQLGDANYELLSVDRPGAAKPNVRIELSHVVDMPEERPPMWFRERIVVICNKALVCQARTTACTVMRGGRAVETYRGTFDLDENGAPAVTGDRRMTGLFCRPR